MHVTRNAHEGDARPTARMNLALAGALLLIASMLVWLYSIGKLGSLVGGDDTLRPELIWLPGGTLQLSEGGSQQVPAFAMCETEVSVRQYEAVTGERPNDGFYGAKNVHPVHNVSWQDAASYLNELTRLENRTQSLALTLCYDEQYVWDQDCTGYRLPTAAEWEYAARAGTMTRWFFGDDESKICDYANINDDLGNCKDGFRSLAPVKTAEFAPNPWGLHGVHGNVWEWTSDVYDTDVARGSPDQVVSGGSYWASPESARSANRNAIHPSSRSVDVGFRCARSASSHR
jgi:formylglycine-generating enzyme required for sulfatase activity